MKWLVRCPVPGDERMTKWGDYPFARSLCGALGRQGQEASLRIHDQWEAPLEEGVDVVLTLRGTFAAAPAAGAINVLWLISHPGDVTTEELRGYDAVGVASETFARELAGALPRRVFPLLQCTDPQIFRPLVAKPRYDLLFVGNSRGVPRPAAIWARELSGYRFAVWGRHWARWLNRSVVEGEHWPNERLAELYAATHLVLNDHYADMKAHGFVNNRVFDALACGRCVLTDGHPGLRRLFPDEVLYFEDRASFANAAAYYFRHREEVAERVARGHQRVLAEHTFEQRAARLLEVAAEVARHRRSASAAIAVGRGLAPPGAPPVSEPRSGEDARAVPAFAITSARPRVTVLSWDVCRNHFSKAYAVAEVLSRHFPVELVGFRFFGELFGPFREESPPFESVYLPAARFPDFQGHLEAAVEAITGEVIYAVKPKLASLGVGLLHQRRHGTPIILEINDLETAVARPGRETTPPPTLDIAALLSGTRGGAEAEADLLDPLHPSWDGLFEGYAELAQRIVTHNGNLDRRFGGHATILRNVKDERFYSPELYDRETLRRALGIAPEERVILFGGLVRRHKGIFETVELLGELGEGYTLLVVGARLDAPDQRRLLAEHGERVRLLPPQSRNAMAQINLASDLVILWLDPAIPASHYQMPYKLTDALAMGVPVIASPVSDLEALGRQGVLEVVPFGDLAAMRVTIRELFADPQATRQMTRRGRELYLEGFSYAAAERVLVPLVEEVAAERVAPPPRLEELASLIAALGGGSGGPTARPAPRSKRLPAADAASSVAPALPELDLGSVAVADGPPGGGEVREALNRVRRVAEERRRRGLGEVATLFRTHLELARRYRDLGEEELVSVIMPAWNREYVIAEAIESVQRQTYGNWELIVADDGSTDRSAEIAAGYAAADARIEVLRLGSNGGAARARNAALAHARGSLVAYLDTDNRWTEHYLSIMVGSFADHPGTSTAYAGYFDIDLDAGTKRILLQSFDWQALLESNFIDLNVFMHRRRLYEELGGFDERLVRQQDWDLALRYTQHERPLVVQAVLSYYYRKSGWQQLSDLRWTVETRSLVLERWRTKRGVTAPESG